MVIEFICSLVGKRATQKLNSDLKKFGIQKGFYNVLTHFHTKVIVSIDTTSYTILQKKPVLLIGNHPYLIEPLVIMGSLPSRKDAYIVATHYFAKLCKNMEKHIIPVHIDHTLRIEEGTVIGRKFVTMLQNKFGSLPREKAHKKNIQNIQDASNKITEGGLVILFPDPKKLKNSTHWFYGIGHLVGNIKNKKSAYVANVHVRGGSPYDFFRLIPGINKFFPSIHLTFAKPQLLSAIIKSTKNPKEITALLEKKYTTWASNLPT